MVCHPIYKYVRGSTLNIITEDHSPECWVNDVLLLFKGIYVLWMPSPVMHRPPQGGPSRSRPAQSQAGLNARLSSLKG